VAPFIFERGAESLLASETVLDEEQTMYEKRTRLV